MEITKDIIVNTNNLIKKHELEIIYSGKLSNSNDISINYGYNANTFEYKTKKLSKDNSIKIKLEKPGYFYFYFSDESGNIDNNDSKDYQLYIKSSNLIITENSSMKELAFRYFSSNDTMYKTFYTPQSIKNTSKPQEIIIPKAFTSEKATSSSKIQNGYTLEPVRPVVTYNLTQALIPTENISMVATIKQKYNNNIINKAFKSINKLLLSIPKAFEKN